MSCISVVMTAYNAEETIAEAIESVLKQSFSDFEFIIVNDGSTDNTLSIINSYHDERIRLIDNRHDYIESLNIGMNASYGKYIARMDADDLMHVDRFKLQYSMMEEFPDITVCCSWQTVFGENISKEIFEQKDSGLIELPLVQLLFDDIIINPSATIRRSFVTEHRLFYEDYTYAEDFKFWADVAKLNGVFYIDTQPLVYRKISSNQITTKFRDLQKQTTLKIKKEILYFLCDKYKKTYPALISFSDSCYELYRQKLIAEDEIFLLIYSLFIKNKDIFKELEHSKY